MFSQSKMWVGDHVDPSSIPGGSSGDRVDERSSGARRVGLIERIDAFEEQSATGSIGLIVRLRPGGGSNRPGDCDAIEAAAERIRSFALDQRSCLRRSLDRSWGDRWRSVTIWFPWRSQDATSTAVDSRFLESPDDRRPGGGGRGRKRSGGGPRHGCHHGRGLVRGRESMLAAGGAHAIGAALGIGGPACDVVVGPETDS